MEEDKTCFVICPIGEKDSDDRKYSDMTCQYIIKPVVEKFGYRVERSDKINESGKITNQIIDKIVDSSLVIADLTNYNPNVFYELAIRHIVGRPYIHMIKSDLKIPFDIGDMRAITYDIDIKQATDAKKSLEGQIKNLTTEKFTPHNPITSANNYSYIKKMLEGDAQIELGDDPKIILKSLYELTSEIKDIKSEIYKLKTTTSAYSQIIKHEAAISAAKELKNSGILRYNYKDL